MRPVFVGLPVHSRRVGVEHLHTVDADVAAACFRVARDDQWQGNVTPTIHRPTFERGKQVQVGIFAG